LRSARQWGLVRSRTQTRSEEVNTSIRDIYTYNRQGTIQITSQIALKRYPAPSSRLTTAPQSAQRSRRSSSPDSHPVPLLPQAAASPPAPFPLPSKRAKTALYTCTSQSRRSRRRSGR
jgi:hypothetical protein